MAYGSVLHINAVGLYAELSELFEPELKGRPFVVAKETGPRSIILDLSPQAHKEGLKQGMLLSLGRRLFPGLEVRHPRPESAAAAEKAIHKIALSYSPIVEKAGLGHFFIDLAGTRRLNGQPEDAACKIRHDISSETGLKPSIALSSGKTASKVGTRVFRPGGFIALSPNEEASLLRRQPVSLLPGVGPVLLERLLLLAIEEIGSLADLSLGEAQALGPRGPALVSRARCEGDEAVDPSPPEKRVLKDSFVLEPDSSDPERLGTAMAALAYGLSFKLRCKGLGFRKAVVSLGYSDGSSGQGSKLSGRLLERDDEAMALAMQALSKARTKRIRIRRLALELSSVAPAGPSLELFEPGELKLSRLQIALDSIRSRYGLESIQPCGLSGMEPQA